MLIHYLYEIFEKRIRGATMEELGALVPLPLRLFIFFLGITILSLWMGIRFNRPKSCVTGMFGLGVVIFMIYEFLSSHVFRYIFR